MTIAASFFRELHETQKDKCGIASGCGIVLAFSPEGKTIASAVNENPEVTLWDVATGKEKFPHEEGRTTSVERMVILDDNRTLVTRDEHERVIRPDLKTGRITGDQVWTIPAASMGICRTTDQTENSLRESSPARISTCSSAFISSNRTVTRPDCVRPTISAPSNSKWSFHIYVRGLNSSTTSRVSGAMLVRFSPLCRLQKQQT